MCKPAEVRINAETGQVDSFQISSPTANWFSRAIIVHWFQFQPLAGTPHGPIGGSHGQRGVAGRSKCLHPLFLTRFSDASMRISRCAFAGPENETICRSTAVRA